MSHRAATVNKGGQKANLPRTHHPQKKCPPSFHFSIFYLYRKKRELKVSFTPTLLSESMNNGIMRGTGDFRSYGQFVHWHLLHRGVSAHRERGNMFYRS